MNLLTSDLLLRAYAAGIFPMSDSADSEALYWFEPELRGVLPLDGLRVPKTTRRVLKEWRFIIRSDTAFKDVLEGCSMERPERPQTWINKPIREACLALARAGYAHSIEAWRRDKLVGGLYGIAMGGAFFAESMFAHEPEASKVCLVELVHRLKAGEFTLLDVQYQNEHLKQFGVVEIPREEYRARLKDALKIAARWTPAG